MNSKACRLCSINRDSVYFLGASLFCVFCWLKINEYPIGEQRDFNKIKHEVES